MPRIEGFLLAITEADIEQAKSRQRHPLNCALERITSNVWSLTGLYVIELEEPKRRITLPLEIKAKLEHFKATGEMLPFECLVELLIP